MNKLIYLVVPAMLLAGGCDDRRIGKAPAVVDGHNLAFDGDHAACLRQVNIRTTGLIDQDDPDDGYVWQVNPPETDGKEDCFHFPITYGEEFPGADVMVPARGFAPNQEYEFEGISDTKRYKRKFQPISGNDVFYVEDKAGKMVDIAKAKQ